MGRGTDILTYDDVFAAGLGENGEPMAAVREVPGLKLAQLSPQTVDRTGPVHLLRASVTERLTRAASALVARASTHSLLLLSSYRNPEYQTHWHSEILEDLRKGNPGLSEIELSREANQRVAAPEVAGHTCGAAVDVSILDPNGELPMGSAYLDFSDPELFKVFSPKVSEDARRNRALLREVMLEAGFAPFNGEWWHFSYGDREWAAYYHRGVSLYSPVRMNEALFSVR